MNIFLERMSYGLGILALALLVSCGNADMKKTTVDDDAQATQSMEVDAMQAADKSGVEYTSAYVCPMHCKGSGGAEAGKCPVCKMDYVANVAEDNHGHDHDDDHDHN